MTSDGLNDEFVRLREANRSVYFKELEKVFSEAESYVLGVERYCKFSALEHPVDHLRFTFKVMDFFLQLMNLEYYRESLKQKKKEFDSRSKGNRF